jgi:alpha-glucosidase
MGFLPVASVKSQRGFEYVTFEQINADLEATHSCVLPFIRNVYAPMDFTPVCFSEVPGIKRITTNGFELALSVIFWSGIQHFVETPEGMAQVPEYVREFVREIPSHWGETRFVDGHPGKLVAIARKSGETWYLAGINGEGIEKRLNLELPFLRSTRTGRLISDGADNRSFGMQTINITPEKPLEVKLKGKGGFVVSFGN